MLCWLTRPSYTAHRASRAIRTLGLRRKLSFPSSAPPNDRPADLRPPPLRVRLPEVLPLMVLISFCGGLGLSRTPSARCPGNPQALRHAVRAGPLGLTPLRPRPAAAFGMAPAATGCFAVLNSLSPGERLPTAGSEPLEPPPGAASGIAPSPAGYLAATNVLIPRNLATSPRVSSILRSWLYLDVRSVLEREPVFI